LNKDLSDIVCALAGPTTQRTFENVRRALEDLQVKSTALGTSAEEQAAFSPELVANVLEAARQDNARTTVAWAKAIYDELQAQELAIPEPDYIVTLKTRLLVAREKARALRRTLTEIEDGRAYPTLSDEARKRQTAGTQRILREAEEDIFSLEHDLRDLRESASEVPGRPPQEGEVGAAPPGHDDLDGAVPPVP
jgi:hypothetical protein